ncbi:iron ABC transporter permease [Rhizobium sp. P38BS-XIX]|uniref:ABC transporter permease n=1 Tax=Rhizobium sp. P38BS-XIX TaxID=2726740 RepID=UPI001457219F|nr:ABC transporter permease subunit [Rhizobium sp. P38BS-XIX]NLS00350.1 iron ABC transporter permease [Rhizobium sp. P38BS-XIX]
MRLSRPRLSGNWRGGAPLLWLAAFILIGLPMLLVLAQAIFPKLFDATDPSIAPSLDAVMRLVTSPRLLRGIVNTIVLGIVGALASTLLGAALALVVHLSDIRLRKLWMALPWIVFATPSYLKGLAWVLLMSQGGYLVYLGILSPPQASSFFGPPGLLLVMALSLFPVPYFIIRARLEGIGGEYIDAARMASAGSMRTISRIIIPMLMPAIGLSLLTTFAEIIGDFGLANTIARSMNFGLLTYNIYAATSSFPVDFPAAGAQALLLAVLVSGSVMAAAASGTQRDARFVSGRNRPLRRYRLGAWQLPAVVLLMLIVVLSAVLPLLAVTLRAFTTSLGGGLALTNFSLSAVRAVFDMSNVAGQALMSSFLYGVVAALMTVAFSALFAFKVSFASKRVRAIAVGLAMITVAVPGIILAFGYILLYDRVPGFTDLGLYGTRTLLVLGYCAAALPYCLIFMWSALDRLGPSISEASRLAGASPMQHLRRIVGPLIGRAIAAAFGVTMVRTIFELPMSQFLMPQAGPALPALIVDDFTQDRDAVACAMALVALLAVSITWGLVFASTRLNAHPKEIDP